MTLGFNSSNSDSGLKPPRSLAAAIMLLDSCPSPDLINATAYRGRRPPPAFACELFRPTDARLRSDKQVVLVMNKFKGVSGAVLLRLAKWWEDSQTERDRKSSVSSLAPVRAMKANIQLTKDFGLKILVLHRFLFKCDSDTYCTWKALRGSLVFDPTVRRYIPSDTEGDFSTVGDLMRSKARGRRAASVLATIGSEAWWKRNAVSAPGQT